MRKPHQVRPIGRCNLVGWTLWIGGQGSPNFLSIVADVLAEKVDLHFWKNMPLGPMGYQESSHGKLKNELLKLRHLLGHLPKYLIYHY